MSNHIIQSDLIGADFFLYCKKNLFWVQRREFFCNLMLIVVDMSNDLIQWNLNGADYIVKKNVYFRYRGMN